jgi:hypothetical protein
MKILKDWIFRFFRKVVISLVFWWKIGYISAYNWPIPIPRPDLERILNSFKMFKWSNQDLRTTKWSTEALKLIKGEKSPTLVKCSIRRNSNIEILMFIYVLWEAKGLFKRVQAKNSWKKICSSFSDRNKLEI